MIIDCHVHLNNYDESREVPLQQRLDNLLSEMSDNGVDCALILTSYKVNTNRPSTREVVELTRDIPNLFVVAGISFVNYREKDLREIADFLKDGLVKGLKLYPGYEPFYPYDPRCRVLYDLAAEFKVPVMIHTGDTYTPKGKLRYAHPLHVDEVAVDHPDVNFVVCHIGNPWIRDGMEVVYKNANAYADVSGLVLGSFQEKFEQYMLQQVREGIMYAGEPQYLLYGTDWPICHMDSYLRFMKGLHLPEASYEKIMWRNTAKLFGIEVPEPSPPRRTDMSGAA